MLKHLNNFTVVSHAHKQLSLVVLLLNINFLLTESEVIAGKYQTEVLP